MSKAFNRRRFLHDSLKGGAAAGLVAAALPHGSSAAVPPGIAAAGSDNPSGALAELHPVPGAAQRQENSVRAYGAVGDGETDDTDAFQRAVDAGAGGVWVPKGRYLLTRPVVIDLAQHGPMSVQGDGTATLVMSGAGPALHLLGSHEGTASPRTVKPIVWERERTPIIDALEIIGDHPGSIGVRVEGTMQAVITRLNVRWAQHGIHLFRRNRNVIISLCHLYENSGVGLFLDRLDLHQVNVTNCHISYNGGGGIVSRESEIRNLHIGTCDIEANHASDGPPTANILLDTRKGVVREGAVVGCTIQHTREAPNSANVRLIGKAFDDPTSVGRFAIAHNAIADADVNVHLDYARGVTITGNVFWVASDHDVLVENSRHVMMSGNVAEQNPDYGSSPRASLLFRDSSDCTIGELHLYRSEANKVPGLTLERCSWMNVTGSQILDCDTIGILMRDVTHSRISDSIIRMREGDASAVAVRFHGGSNNMMVDNLIRGRLDLDEGVVTIDGNTLVE